MDFAIDYFENPRCNISLRVNKAAVRCRDEQLVEAPQLTEDSVTARLIQLGEHIVQQNYWRFSGLLKDQFGNSELRAQSGCSMLSLRAKFSEIHPLDITAGAIMQSQQKANIVPVWTD